MKTSESSVRPPLIYLIGARGSGKSTVGHLLAERLGWRFLDADAVVEERAGQSIAAVFAGEGEAGFRDRETAILAELSTLHQHVIATGGGVVLRPGNRKRLRTSGYCVWLTGEPATLYLRLLEDPTTRDRRPALTSLPGPAEVERLLREREPLYREVAQLVVSTEGQSPEGVVSAILSAWATSSCSSP
jgi:shikimate kinase